MANREEIKKVIDEKELAALEKAIPGVVADLGKIIEHDSAKRELQKQIEDLDRQTSEKRAELTEQLREQENTTAESRGWTEGRFVKLLNSRYASKYGEYGQLKAVRSNSSISMTGWGKLRIDASTGYMLVEFWPLNKDASHKKSRGNRYSEPEEIVEQVSLVLGDMTTAGDANFFEFVTGAELEELQELEEKRVKKELMEQIKNLDTERMKALLEHNEQVEKVSGQLTKELEG